MRSVFNPKMTEKGQRRSFDRVRVTSAFPLIATESRTSHHVGNGPISDILECGWEEPANTSKVETDVRSCQRCGVMVPFRQVVVQFWLLRSTKPPKRKEAANLGGLH
jgi:hypothetical protein